MYAIPPDAQDLIFAHSLGMYEGPDLLRAEELIASDSYAAELNAILREAVAPLSFMPAEYCPDELADRTLERLRTLAQRNRRTPSAAKVIRLGWGLRLSNATGAAVVAACILLIVGVLVPSSNMMRQRSYSQLCRAGLARLLGSLNQYAGDHDGFLPAVARAEGASWHAIGDSGPASGSNTQNAYLLLSSHYTEDPADFLCCGMTRNDAPPLTPADVGRYRDFPSRDHITYSFRLMPVGRLKMAALGARPLIADMNPHFENVAAGTARGWPPALDDKTLRLNSINHGRRGQNVAFGDGHARYMRTRFVGDSEEDIYTMEGGVLGDGCRLPSCLNDTMLAP